MKPYKIAFVLDDSLDTPDGVQQYVLNVGKWFSAQGNDVHYIVGESKRTDLPNLHSIGRNVKVRFNQNRMSIPLPVPKRKIRDLLQREQFDVLHVQMPYSPFLAGRVVKQAGSKTAVLASFHIAPHSQMVHIANKLLSLMVRGSIKRFDKIIAVSPVAQSFAKDTFGVDSVVIPNTLDLTPFYAPQPFAEYQKTTNIVFFGRLVERKGCQYFLRAINRLNRANALPANCKVLVCGKGPLEAQLKSYVQANNLGDVVTFTGFVAEEDKPRYLATGDIIVYPSTGGESFGIVLLEGMAAGRGVVLAGDNPGYAGVIGERPEALFDPTNEAAFAEKIKLYLENPSARTKARVWQQNYVTKFDIPHVGDKILAEYASALHKRTG